jgi:hypothetical protein
MAKHCEVCKRPLKDRTNRFCQRHSQQALRDMERSGYLQPLTLQTQDGKVRLAERRFLTQPDDDLLRSCSNCG